MSHGQHCACVYVRARSWEPGLGARFWCVLDLYTRRCASKSLFLGAFARELVPKPINMIMVVDLGDGVYMGAQPYLN
jgi:hypothetical protein